jgi:D-glycero-beta-D-manno-heptose 1-phosphate adenylyltransferase
MENLNLIESKIFSQENLQNKLAFWKFKDQKIVFTNGCFDLLHLGHVEYLAKAKDLGNILVVGLNSDESVRKLKGPHRPINHQHARALTLAAFFFVDAVVIFEEETPVELIRMVQPDILVKGKDYKEHEIAGNEIVKAKGGRIVTIDLVKGFSSSQLIEKIHKHFK